MSTPAHGSAARRRTPWSVLRWGVALTTLQAPLANGSELPRCEARQLHSEAFAVQTLAEGEPSSLPYTGPGCPFERPTYECGPQPPPRQQLAADGCRLDPWPAGSAPFANGSHVLLTGNSYARQVFQTLLCQYSDAITVVETTTSTLEPNQPSNFYCKSEQLRPWSHPTLPGSQEGPGKNGAGRGLQQTPPSADLRMVDDLAHVTFNNGARLYGAFNGHFLIRGMDYLLSRLGLPPRDLDALYIKHPNGVGWLKHRLRQCGWYGKAIKSFREGKSLFNSTFVVDDLARRGFAGKVVVTDESLIEPGLQAKLRQHDRFLVIPNAIQGNASFACRCQVHDCTPGCGHQCMPGPVDMEAHVLSHALRWHGR